MTALSETPIGVQNIRLKIVIQAPKERVWNALTTDIGKWWPASFCVSGMENVTYVVEPHVGGRVFEDAGDGKGVMWCQVVTYNPCQTLQMAGDTFPGYGGPGRAFSTYTLEEKDGSTTVDFDYSALGPMSESNRDSMHTGWTFLYQGCMKAFLEGREAPEWTGECGA